MRHVIGIQRSIPELDPHAITFSYFSQRHPTNNDNLALIEVGVCHECGQRHARFGLLDELTWNRVPSTEVTSCNQARRHESLHKPEQTGTSSQLKSHLGPHYLLSPIYLHQYAYPFSSRDATPSVSHIEWRSQINILSDQSGPPRLARNSRGRNRRDSTTPSLLRMG